MEIIFEATFDYSSVGNVCDCNVCDCGNADIGD
mgnify:CR=1 FL=1